MSWVATSTSPDAEHGVIQRIQKSHRGYRSTLVMRLWSCSGKRYRRETSTMPQWAGSCWYYLRYLQPWNTDRAIDPEVEKYWLPVDLYVGEFQALLNLYLSMIVQHASSVKIAAILVRLNFCHDRWCGACCAAPVVCQVLAQGAVRSGCGVHQGALPAASEPGHDPRRSERLPFGFVLFEKLKLWQRLICGYHLTVTCLIQVEYTAYKDAQGQYVDENHPEATAVRFAPIWSTCVDA